MTSAERALLGCTLVAVGASRPISVTTERRDEALDDPYFDNRQRFDACAQHASHGPKKVTVEQALTQLYGLCERDYTPACFKLGSSSEDFRQGKRINCAAPIQTGFGGSAGSRYWRLTFDQRGRVGRPRMIA
jgi:hypothetical protein